MIDENLNSLAEVAITLAGFTGLLASFRSSDTSIMGEIRRISYIFAMCFSIVVAAYAPGIINEFLPGSSLVWSAPVLFLGVAAIIISVIALIQFNNGSVELALPIASYTFIFMLGAVGVILLSKVVGFLPGSDRGYLLTGLLWFLLHGGYIFVATMIWGTGENQGEA